MPIKHSKTMDNRKQSLLKIFAGILKKRASVDTDQLDISAIFDDVDVLDILSHTSVIRMECGATIARPLSDMISGTLTPESSQTLLIL